MEHRAELVQVIRRVRNRWRVQARRCGGGDRGRRHGAGAAAVGAWPRSVPVQRAGHHRLPHPAFAVFVALRGCTGWCGRCGDASPTRRSRSISRSTSRRSKRRSSAPSRPNGRRRRPAQSPAPRRASSCEHGDRESAARSNDGRGVERAACSATSARSAGVAAVAALIILLGPAYLRHGSRRCSSSRAASERPSRTASRSRPATTPVPRGADQAVTAKLVGFTVDRRRR